MSINGNATERTYTYAYSQVYRARRPSYEPECLHSRDRKVSKALRSLLSLLSKGALTTPNVVCTQTEPAEMEDPQNAFYVS